jgi:hypothetical protein
LVSAKGELRARGKGGVTSRPKSLNRWSVRRAHHARHRPPHGAAGSPDLARVAEGPRGHPFFVAANLQIRQAAAVATHDGLRKRTARARVEAHLARMLAFDFEPGVKEWRRACAAQGWYWTREQQADLLGGLPGPFEPIERDLGPAVAAVWALYEGTFKDACVMDWTLEQVTMELAARLQLISLGHHRRDRR